MRVSPGLRAFDKLSRLRKFGALGKIVPGGARIRLAASDIGIDSQLHIIGYTKTPFSTFFAPGPRISALTSLG